MFDADYNKIMAKWQNGFEQGAELFGDSQKCVTRAAKNFFDGLHYFSELYGNEPMGEFYKSLSQHFDELLKVEKSKK